MTEDREPPIILATERLIVRDWDVSDADRFFDIYGREEVVRWLGAAPIADRDEAVARIERSPTRLAGDPRFGSWAVVDRARGVPIGGVLLKPLPDGDGEIEIGWHLHPDSWGNGFATEAAAAVLERGFATGVPEVWAVTFLDNAASAAVARRIGMRLLGVTSRWYHEPHLMFWVGSGPDREPSLQPDGPAPPTA